jgi:hypothetical protein
MESAEKKFQGSRASIGGSTRIKTNRTIRRITNNENIFVKEPPRNTFGKDGDIVLYEDKKNYNKIEQYLKTQGRWINITTGRPTTDSAVVKKWIKAKTG